MSVLGTRDWQLIKAEQLIVYHGCPPKSAWQIIIKLRCPQLSDGGEEETQETRREMRRGETRHNREERRKNSSRSSDIHVYTTTHHEMSAIFEREPAYTHAVTLREIARRYNRKEEDTQHARATDNCIHRHVCAPVVVDVNVSENIGADLGGSNCPNVLCGLRVVSCVGVVDGRVCFVFF